MRCVALVLFLALALAASAVAQRPVVPGYDRARTDAQHAALAGEILLDELNCVACHHPPKAVAARLPVRRAPALANLVKRLAPEVVTGFVAAPHRFKPGTTMPDLFAGESDPSIARDIAAHVARGKHVPFRGRTLGTIERGRELFETIGCAACHATPGGAPIGLGPHYEFPALVAFLRDPHTLRPDGRMPDLQLSLGDARDVAEYVRSLRRPITKRRVEVDRERGAKHYVARGCAACHEPERDGAAVGKPLATLDVSRGCLSEAPRAPAAHYHLDATQRRDLAAAIRRLKGTPAPLTRSVRVFRTLATLDCFACHTRDGRGGPDAKRDHLFVGDPDLGDEGRLPPSLTGVGKKLTATALRDVLAGKRHVRPYLHTRMPRFAKSVLRGLADDLMTVDAPPAAKPLVGDANAGRLLLGTKGLGCITCHGLGAHRSVGIGATDLTGVTERLRPEFFRRMLLDPSAVRHGTLMPGFWPKGKSTRQDILGGDTDKQIAALWSYLQKPEPAPVGYPPPRGTYELVPKQKTLLLRCFMRGAGTQAIAVGAPGGVHFAFDAEAVRPATAWRGRFVDAYSTWFTRFQEPVAPLGKSVVTLPAASFGAGEPVFGGYRLDPRGVPTFFYRVGQVQVEDRLTPTADGKGLRRVLRAHGAVRFRPGTAKGVQVRVESKPNNVTEVVYTW